MIKLSQYKEIIYNFADRKFNKGGYVFIRIECRNEYSWCVNSYINESHAVYFKHYQKDILTGYHIHHIDMNKLNNDISNLMLMTANDHNKLHGYISTKNIPAVIELYKTYKYDYVKNVRYI